MMRNRLLLLFLLLAAFRLDAQVRVVSPLSKGILQVRGDHALLHFRAAVPQYIRNFSVSLLSDTSTQDPYVVRQAATPTQGWLDTMIDVPRSLRNYTLWWFGDSSGQPLQGSISGLTPGHIFGIAGQSNAVGYWWKYDVAEPQGDIRMLHNDSTWERAYEPTGNLAAGPWIVMANEMYQQIGDTLPVGIINVAVGATGLTVGNQYGGIWARDSLGPEDSGYYGRALHRFREAGGFLEALFWIQGEADCTAVDDPNKYRNAFAALMTGFRTDLDDTLPIFHSQIAAFQDYPGGTHTAVREAHRVLPLSTLVGTAIGRSLQADGVHYTDQTYASVGRMFADAVLVERYGKTATHMYPPVLPADMAQFDSLLDGGQKKYCISLRFHRSRGMSALNILTDKQYFSLYRDGLLYDTSEVWVRRSPTDSTTVLIGLRQDSITAGHEWTVTYDAIASTDEAPLAIFDPVSHDTVYATAFDKLPVKMPQQKLSVELERFDIVPTPATDVVNCRIYSNAPHAVTIKLVDERGAELQTIEAALHTGVQTIPINAQVLTSGRYWLEVSGEGMPTRILKTLIIR